MQIQDHSIYDAQSIERALLHILGTNPRFDSCMRSIIKFAQHRLGASGGFFWSVDDVSMNIAVDIDEAAAATWNEGALSITFDSNVVYNPPLPDEIEITFPVYVVAPIHDAEKLVGLLWLLFDTVLDDNLREQLDVVLEGAKTAVQAEARFRDLYRNQSEFVRIVSHDLRSPLTSMQGFASMLEAEMVGELNEKQKHFVSKILAGITQMTALVDNIQDAGRFDMKTGFYEMSRSHCDLVEIVNNVVENHSVAAEIQELTLTGHVSDNVPIISADRNMLERAISNLVDNAIKYTPNAGRVEVQAERQEHDLIISVADNGFGIDEENVKKLFNRHVRIVRREHKKIKGTGLGLFIVRSVAQRHGGDAWVTSTEGEGSTFFISIPLEGDNLI